MTKKFNITIVGAGYVGMSLAVLLSKDNNVTLLDINKDRVNEINSKISPVKDALIHKFLKHNKLNLCATNNKKDAYSDANFIIVATPTDFDSKTNKFNTYSVDSVVKEAIKYNKNALIVIKSTIPIGHTDTLQAHHSTDRVIFSPEFLREGKSLYDCLHPSRIVIGSKIKKAKIFGELLSIAAEKENVIIMYTSSKEAESIKLFSNTYLAMRVSFFNELDSFVLENKLQSKHIIEGICLDERVGQGYNNPSFGYGGYCLPKDTKQLLANYNLIPQSLMEAIVSSNETRKDFIAKKIIDLKPNIVGINRLVMKKDSDNFRSSAILGIIDRLKESSAELIIYEPSYCQVKYNGIKVISNIQKFKTMSDVIVSNRIDNYLEDVYEKCFTRDIYKIN